MKSINASHFENIPTFPKGGDRYAVHAIVETPRDTRHKYAFDTAYGIFALKTTIAEGLAWPYDYGFIPQTLGQDGDPLDVLFLSDEPTFSGCLVESRLLGIIRLEKNGKENDRLIACATRIDGTSQSTDAYKTIKDVPNELIESLVHFLTQYSSDADNEIQFKGVHGRRKALAAVEVGIKLFNKKKRK